MTYVSINASDSSIVYAGRLVNKVLGTPKKPGRIPYFLLPGAGDAGANSNSAAYTVADIKAIMDGEPRETQPTPAGELPGTSNATLIEFLARQQQDEDRLRRRAPR